MTMKWMAIGMGLALVCIGCATTDRPERSDFMNRVLAQLDLVQPGCDCQVLGLPVAAQIPQLANPEAAVIDWPRGHHFRVVAERSSGRFWVERTVNGKTEVFGPGELREE